MGTLKENAVYIYERANGKIFAREFGSTERRLIGYDADNPETARVKEHINDILTMCETDKVMQDCLNHLFMLYNFKRIDER